MPGPYVDAPALEPPLGKGLGVLKRARLVAFALAEPAALEHVVVFRSTIKGIARVVHAIDHVVTAALGKLEYVAVGKATLPVFIGLGYVHHSLR